MDNDKDWKKWKISIVEEYSKRDQTIQKIIENQGYKILKEINFKNKKILEVDQEHFHILNTWKLFQRNI